MSFTVQGSLGLPRQGVDTHLRHVARRGRAPQFNYTYYQVVVVVVVVLVVVIVTIAKVFLKVRMLL